MGCGMKTLAFVLVATIREASGDAVIRLLLHSHSMAGRSGDTTSIKACRSDVMVIDYSL
jgi:hypothetical protein